VNPLWTPHNLASVGALRPQIPTPGGVGRRVGSKVGAGVGAGLCEVPLSSELGTNKTVKARFWHWLPCESPQNLSRSSLFARKQVGEQLLHRNVQLFRGGLVIQAHRLCISLNSRLESNKEEEVMPPCRPASTGARCWELRERERESWELREM